MWIIQKLTNPNHWIKIALVSLGTWTTVSCIMSSHPRLALLAAICTVIQAVDVWIEADSGQEDDWRRVAKRADIFIFTLGTLIIMASGL